MITNLQIAQVRRMVNEPTDSTYTDVAISGYYDTLNSDINAVASEIWGEKASAIQATNYDFSADNASYKLSQTVDYAIERAKYYASRRNSTSSLWVKSPVETASGIQVN